ncbi:MAG: UDP-N-acetylglucosamine 2-epimerase (non-hydrolyzing) [Rhodocyclaceae bacterium]|nr:UDP-N-acetylglucosamine 2-epimerase (non-hydrolyzing) [Rhodocyclaceae bacterium]
MRVMTVFGTRPEAIKLAPVVRALRAMPSLQSIVCSTGQHRSMLDQILPLFEIVPNYDLDLMKPGQSLAHITTAALNGVEALLVEHKPDWVIVQGDTTTAFAASLAAFYHKIKVAHVEAGLRTGNPLSPYPEEVNRKLITQVAHIHFAPTEWAANNLRREAVPEKDIMVTGNTVIDALHHVEAQISADASFRSALAQPFEILDRSKSLILVTGHRRENFDDGIGNMCQALGALAARGDVEIVFPVHLNPQVQQIVGDLLAGKTHIHLIEPQAYASFVYLMQRCDLIITDSGGVQEEGPAFGKPVLVTRDTTERPEAIEAGTALLIGRSTEALVASANHLLDDPAAYKAMAVAKNPFGDGRAAGRIVAALQATGSAAA